VGFGADDRVQPGVLAGPGQLHIQPVHVFAAGKPDQGPPPGQPLGAVAGGGIGQVHPPVALTAAATIQIGPGQSDCPAALAVQLDGYGSGLGVEGSDGPATAVGHSQLRDGVVTAHDPIPDRQLEVLDLEPLGSEAAAGGQQLLAGGVEPIHLGPAGSQHHHLLGRVPLGLLPGGPPVLEEGQRGGRLGVGSHHPVMSLVGGHRLLDQATADEVEGFAFPGLLLAAVLGQLGGADAEPQGAEAAAGVDRRQLPVIADQHHLGPGLVGVLEQAGQFAAAQHAGLIDHQHGAGVQLLVAALELSEQAAQVATSSNPSPCRLTVAIPVGAVARSR
jgi:hypothetical protein